MLQDSCFDISVESRISCRHHHQTHLRCFFKEILFFKGKTLQMLSRLELICLSCHLFQEGDRRVKMQNMVRFPLMGMDMAPHVVKRSQSSWSLPSHWSPWRRPYSLGRNPDDYLYDLYAVCNHHGNMHGGHYTGNALNSCSSSKLMSIIVI